MKPCTIGAGNFSWHRAAFKQSLGTVRLACFNQSAHKASCLIPPIVKNSIATCRSICSRQAGHALSGCRNQIITMRGPFSTFLYVSVPLEWQIWSCTPGLSVLLRIPVAGMSTSGLLALLDHHQSNFYSGEPMLPIGTLMPALSIVSACYSLLLDAAQRAPYAQDADHGRLCTFASFMDVRKAWTTRGF